MNIIQRLLSYPDLTALVSNRIWPVKAPDNPEPPYCIVSQISSTRFYSHDGFSSIVRQRYQVSCFDKDYTRCRSVKQQVIKAMELWPTVDSTVSSVMHANDQELYEPDTGYYHMPIDFLVYLEEV